MILSGGSVRPSKAKKIGLVDAVIPFMDRHDNEHRFFSESRRFALTLVGKSAIRAPRKPSVFSTDFILDQTRLGHYIVAKKAVENLDNLTKGKYPAPYLALDSVLHSLSVSDAEGLQYEAKQFGRLSATPESKSLMALFYMMESSKKIKASIKAKPAKVKKVFT